MSEQHHWNRDARLRRAALADKTNNRRKCDLGMTGAEVPFSVGKRSYTSFGQAKRAASALSEVHGKAFDVYRCRCGKWHTTTRQR